MAYDDWLLAVQTSLIGVRVDAMEALSSVDPRKIQLNDLVLGRELGLISLREIVAVELRRRELGIALSDDEETIALALSDDLDAVDEILRHSYLPPEAVTHAKELWLYLIVDLMSCNSEDSLDDFPERRYVELESAWGGPTFLQSFLAKKAGLDRWYFGAGARRRFFTGLDRAVAAERVRLGLADDLTP